MNQEQIQALVDGMNAKMQRDRGAQQLTLGALIETLTALRADECVRGLGELMSYRGYYCDLAFAPSDTEESVEALLARCRDSMGRVFQGYKGGDYQMGETTPLWARRRRSGSRPTAPEAATD